MKEKNKVGEKYAYWMIRLLIFAGMTLRILMYRRNRSLFMDEACLSSQLIDRSYLGLLDNLEYQYAPPFFAMLIKGMAQLFGEHEYALRLFPLIAALVSLVLFYKLCHGFIADRFIIFPMFLFAFGMPILQYATEVKQYSSDILMTIGFLLLFFQWRIEWGSKKVLVWAILGAAMVWFSMPSVFILFGIGIGWLYELWKDKDWGKAKFPLFAILSWLFSFGVYYFSIIRKDIGLQGLEDYHARFFLPLPPNSWAELNQVKEIIITFFRTGLGPTFLDIGIGILFVLIGGYSLGVKKRPWVLVLVLPFLAVLIASGFHLYSLIPRLILFLMPIIFLLIGIGTKEILARSPKWMKWILIPCMIIVMSHQTGIQYFYKPFQLEELKPVLYQVQSKLKEGDQAYLYSHATHAYVFYSQHYKDAANLVIPGIQLGGWEDRPKSVELEDAKRRWLIFSHAYQTEVDAYLDVLGEGYQVKEQFKAKNAWGILLVKE